MGYIAAAATMQTTNVHGGFLKMMLSLPASLSLSFPVPAKSRGDYLTRECCEKCRWNE